MKHTHVGNFSLKIPDALQLGIKHYVMGVEGCPPTLVDKTSECPQGLLSPSASGQQPFLPLQMSSPPPFKCQPPFIETIENRQLAEIPVVIPGIYACKQ
jgi:hypothetical protein